MYGKGGSPRRRKRREWGHEIHRGNDDFGTGTQLGGHRSGGRSHAHLIRGGGGAGGGGGMAHRMGRWWPFIPQRRRRRGRMGLVWHDTSWTERLGGDGSGTVWQHDAYAIGGSRSHGMGGANRGWHGSGPTCGCMDQLAWAWSESNSTLFKLIKKFKLPQI
jgi:hypothetical protein